MKTKKPKLVDASVNTLLFEHRDTRIHIEDIAEEQEFLREVYALYQDINLLKLLIRFGALGSHFNVFPYSIRRKSIRKTLIAYGTSTTLELIIRMKYHSNPEEVMNLHVLAGDYNTTHKHILSTVDRVLQRTDAPFDSLQYYAPTVRALTDTSGISEGQSDHSNQLAGGSDEDAIFRFLQTARPNDLILFAKQEQLRTPLYATLIYILRQDVPINEAHLTPAQLQYSNFCRLNRDDFVIAENGLLHRFRGNTLLFCVPPTMVNFIIHEAHNLPVSGHLGKMKTIFRVRQHYWWYSLNRDVATYVARCPLCLAHKGRLKRVRQQLGRIPNPTDVWQRLHMDVWTPGGRARDGSICVIGFIDVFSKFLILIPLKQHRAIDIARAFILGVVIPYGVPAEITSDGAPEFRSYIVREFFRLFGVKHHITTPYRPQANGQIERIFRTIRPIVATIAVEKPQQWSKCLPQVAFAYNTAYHETVKNTPFFLMFGRDPIVGLFSTFRNITELTPDLHERIEHLTLARSSVAKHLADSQEDAEERYNATAQPKEFHINDVVYLETLVIPRDSVHKLYPRFIGPYRIRQIMGPVIGVTPLEFPNSEVRYIHSDRAKQCDRNAPLPTSTIDYGMPFRCDDFSEDPNLEQSRIETSTDDTRMEQH
jgi:transposase InsO family protein